MVLDLTRVFFEAGQHLFGRLKAPGRVLARLGGYTKVPPRLGVEPWPEVLEASKTVNHSPGRYSLPGVSRSGSKASYGLVHPRPPSVL